jgi:hypothetical protein
MPTSSIFSNIQQMTSCTSFGSGSTLVIRLGSAGDGMPTSVAASVWTNRLDVEVASSIITVAAGEFLMGAGGAARWPSPNSTLVERMMEVVDGIAATQEADGYIMAFTRNETIVRENPDYVVSWLTHGLLEAAIAGSSKALPMLRQHFNWFNNCTWVLLQLCHGPDHSLSVLHM